MDSAFPLQTHHVCLGAHCCMVSLHFFTEAPRGFTVLGSFITIILGIGVFWTVYWIFKFREARRLELHGFS
jgi:hypothetical protein